MDEIAVIGYPSKLGGADTELDHQIDVWLKMNLRVHLIHTSDIDMNLKAMNMEERGCIVHEPRDWKACTGMPVISFCNGEFLKDICSIRDYASKIFWVNCMSWLFPAEIEAHKEGLIDFFVYQTHDVMRKSAAVLRKHNKNFSGFVINPYFRTDDYPFVSDRNKDYFRFCRISREDLAKFHPAQLWVYETMMAPELKSGCILGFNEKIEKKIGKLPNWIRGLSAGSMPVQDLYRHAHACIQMSDPSLTENLPRVGFEAMAMGCVLCCDNRGGWQREVVHGQTGFLCSDEREFVYYSTRLAFENGERTQLARNARDHLDSNWGMSVAKESWTEFFNVALA